jgi:hypothetical protein
MDQPDWHLRWPFLLALAGIAIGLSVFAVWWAGLLILAWIAVMYLWFKLGGL